MRYFWITVMLVLLPLRGWAGQLMSVDMAMQQVTKAVTSAGDPADGSQLMTLAFMPDDCPMHAMASETTSNGQPDAGSPPCSGCDTCELCLTIASFTPSEFHATAFSPTTAPAAMPHGFVNADRASRLKPPIS